MNDRLPKSPKANRYSPTDRPPSFERAEVPSYLLKLEIDSLPANRVFYIDTESEESWNDSPTMIVNKNTGTLYLDGSAEVDDRADKPTTPIGLVGIMRVETITKGGEVASFFVGDLRFLENHELPIVDDIDNAPTDQEDFNGWMDMKKDLREVAAFVAPVPASKASKDGIMPALYYGPEELYGALDVLRERGDKLITKQIKRQRQQKKLAKAASKEQTPTAANEKAKETSSKPIRRLFTRKR